MMRKSVVMSRAASWEMEKLLWGASQESQESLESDSEEGESQEVHTQSGMEVEMHSGPPSKTWTGSRGSGRSGRFGGNRFGNHGSSNVWGDVGHSGMGKEKWEEKENREVEDRPGEEGHGGVHVSGTPSPGKVERSNRSGMTTDSGSGTRGYSLQMARLSLPTRPGVNGQGAWRNRRLFVDSARQGEALVVEDDIESQQSQQSQKSVQSQTISGTMETEASALEEPVMEVKDEVVESSGGDFEESIEVADYEEVEEEDEEVLIQRAEDVESEQKLQRMQEKQEKQRFALSTRGSQLHGHMALDSSLKGYKHGLAGRLVKALQKRARTVDSIMHRRRMQQRGEARALDAEAALSEYEWIRVHIEALKQQCGLVIARVQVVDTSKNAGLAMGAVLMVVFGATALERLGGPLAKGSRVVLFAPWYSIAGKPCRAWRRAFPLSGALCAGISVLVASTALLEDGR